MSTSSRDGGRAATTRFLRYPVVSDPPAQNLYLCLKNRGALRNAVPRAILGRDEAAAIFVMNTIATMRDRPRAASLLSFSPTKLLLLRKWLVPSGAAVSPAVFLAAARAVPGITAETLAASVGAGREEAGPRAKVKGKEQETLSWELEP
eukprot:CAMPEP_0114494126 /NCGR_PEP_ID=MMETSP0109-20121206/4482_1 /TAXON_ID=29199 /ORGANISM="Chlorarachnion reptans, Strain CCCM449" /LENGTH=148 /DNA_ID=CAMNT_0001671135 /DNA_START=615 /DNA_END=1057 /DNA_ORIENTATION=-